MPFTLRELHSIARTAGVPDVRGIPLPALVAAIAMEESSGDTRARSGIRREDGTLEPSFGLLQVNEPSWPGIAAETKALMRRRMNDYTRAIAQIRAAKPILEDAARQAVKAAERLKARGFPAGPVEVMLLMDAAWQGPLRDWADRTTTGNIAEIREKTSPGRTAKVRAHLKELGAANPMLGLGALLGFLGLGGIFALFLWAIGEWADEA